MRFLRPAQAAFELFNGGVGAAAAWAQGIGAALDPGASSCKDGDKDQQPNQGGGPDDRGSISETPPVFGSVRRRKGGRRKSEQRE